MISERKDEEPAPPAEAGGTVRPAEAGPGFRGGPLGIIRHPPLLAVSHEYTVEALFTFVASSSRRAGIAMALCRYGSG